jgi:hypothetical protein
MTMAADDDNRTNEAADARLEARLLIRVLEFQPARVTTDELVRDLTGAEDDFAARDGIERAIAELTRAGLLHPVADDGFVTPTLAAVRVGRLLEHLS